MRLPRFARNDMWSVIARLSPICHCEERSDEAICPPSVVARLTSSAEAISVGTSPPTADKIVGKSENSGKKP